MNCGHRCVICFLAVGFVIASGFPPFGGTRNRPDVGLVEITMLLSGAQVIPRGFTILSASITEAPPLSGALRSLVSATYATHCPSGDGSIASRPSVSGRII